MHRLTTSSTQRSHVECPLDSRQDYSLSAKQIMPRILVVILILYTCLAGVSPLQAMTRELLSDGHHLVEMISWDGCYLTLEDGSIFQSSEGDEHHLRRWKEWASTSPLIVTVCANSMPYCLRREDFYITALNMNAGGQFQESLQVRYLRGPSVDCNPFALTLSFLDPVEGYLELSRSDRLDHSSELDTHIFLLEEFSTYPKTTAWTVDLDQREQLDDWASDDPVLIGRDYLSCYSYMFKSPPYQLINFKNHQTIYVYPYIDPLTPP